MRSVEPPNFNLDSFFDELVLSYRESTLIPSINSKKPISEGNKIYARDAFTKAKSVLLKAELDYIENMTTHNNKINQKGQYVVHNNIADKLQNGDYQDLYKKFRGLNQTSHFVQQLLNIAKNKCIYCEKRHGAEELDHFLPKTEFDYLTIVPSNLLPCCSECNKKKMTEEEFFHPYFTNINDFNLVICDIEIYSSEQELIDFTDDSTLYMIPTYQLISQDLANDLVLYKKVKMTFNSLDLSRRYSNMMTEIIEEDIVEFQKILESAGVEALILILKNKEQSFSRSYSENSYLLPYYKKLISLLENNKYFLKIFKRIYI